MKKDDSIGVRIKETRIKKGLTQQQVADSIGVTYQNISQYERGVRIPKNETLIKIADALGVSVYELIGFNGANTNDVPLAILQQVYHSQPNISSNVHHVSVFEKSADSEEIELITIYRDLNDIGQSALIGTARGLAANPDMKKASKSSEETTA